MAAEYEALAHKANFKYNGVPQNQNGPILALLRSLPTATALAVGALGEWSREVGHLITDIGEKGSTCTERSGCCHGMGQARGIISSHALPLSESNAPVTAPPPCDLEQLLGHVCI
jgi:hypothetical protein